MAQLLLVRRVVGGDGRGVVGHGGLMGGLDGVEHGELGRAEEAGEEVLARGHEGDDEEGDEEAEAREVDRPAEAYAARGKCEVVRGTWRCGTWEVVSGWWQGASGEW